jgi:hypothetical protein
MKFPTSLSVTVMDKASGLPIPNVALVLVLRARSKNDYYVGPVITDEDGNLAFTRKDCEEAIAIAQEMFVMDYAGDLLSCGPIAEIKLHEPEHIANMIQQFKQAPEFWGKGLKEPILLFESLQKVNNSSFHPQKILIAEDSILKCASIELRLVPR